ncbi:MAG: hypothetical protein LBG88_02755 [Christensenellaceae bacterium]|jgi:regulator of protease activity HflC (stomatin/prohibitin superfamily)|nr:hypothetical protein [Christensenellaceae bacterium]
MNTVEILLAVGGILILVFIVAAILYYLQNNVRVKNAKPEVDEFQRRNDSRDIKVLDVSAETAKYNAHQPPKDEIAALEAIQIEDKRTAKEAHKAEKKAEKEAHRQEKEAYKAEKEAKEAEKEAEREAAKEAARAEKEAIRLADEAAREEAKATESSDLLDLFSDKINDRADESKNGDFSFESFMERKEDIRNEVSRRDEKRAEKEREKHEREAQREAERLAREQERESRRKERETPSVFMDNETPGDNLFASFGFGQEPTAAAAVKKDPDMFGSFFKDEVEKEEFTENAERGATIEDLQRQKEQYEKELSDQYNKNHLDATAMQETLAQREAAERKLKDEYDAYKASIEGEKEELERKNRELFEKLREAEMKAHTAQLAAAANTAANTSTNTSASTLDMEAERARIAAQLRQEYDQNEKLLSDKYMQLRSELQRETAALAEKSDAVRREMEEVQRQKELATQQSNDQTTDFELEKELLEKRFNDEKDRLEREKARLEEENARLEEEQQAERARLQTENSRLKNELMSAPDQVKTIVETVVDTAEMDRMKAKLQREYEENERALREKYETMQDQLRQNEHAMELHRRELEKKEEMITIESQRLVQETTEFNAMMTERSYTAEERNRFLEDYYSRTEELRNRLKSNEKAIRQNNREFVPLRRIKDTLERDMKLLRKREAMVAKQQVLVYGVNNISTLDPERVKKLEQDVQQLTGLQQSVANCEDILAKNKDRYPTLANLDRVLKEQNKQLVKDLDEVQKAIEFFENYVPGNKK